MSTQFIVQEFNGSKWIDVKIYPFIGRRDPEKLIEQTHQKAWRISRESNTMFGSQTRVIIRIETTIAKFGKTKVQLLKQGQKNLS